MIDEEVITKTHHFVTLAHSKLIKSLSHSVLMSETDCSYLEEENMLGMQTGEARGKRLGITGALYRFSFFTLSKISISGR